MTTRKTTKTDTAEAAIQTGQDVVEKAVQAGQEAIDKAVQMTSDGYEKAFSSAKEKLDETMKQFDDAASFGKESVDIATQSGTILAKGVETLSGEFMAFSKKAMEDNLEATKSVMAAKTIQEAVDLQSGYVRDAFGGYLAYTTKMGEMYTKIVQEAAEPINARMTATMDKWSKLAA